MLMPKQLTLIIGFLLVAVSLPAWILSRFELTQPQMKVNFKAFVLNVQRQEPPTTVQDSCAELLRYGSYENNIWKPRGCKMFNYSQFNVSTCMDRKKSIFGHYHVAFLGDSRVQETYYQMAAYFKNEVKTRKNHNDQKSMIPQFNLIVEHLYRQYIHMHEDTYKAWLKRDLGSGRPDIVVAGVAAWHIRYGEKGQPRSAALATYKSVFKDKIVPLMQKLTEGGKTRVIWKVQDPVVDANMGPDKNRQLLTNQQFNAYNDVSTAVLNGTDIEIWSSGRQVAFKWLHNMGDGVHFRENTSSHDQSMQIFFNNICNENMNVDDDMCCSKGRKGSQEVFRNSVHS